MKDKSKLTANNEVPPELKNIETDFDHFNIYSTDYDKEFDVDYTNMNVLLGIVNPLKYKNDVSGSSSELDEELKTLVNSLHELEECLIKAGPESKIRMSAFGIPEVKACIQAREFGRLKEKLEVVLKNIDTSITSLVEYGFQSGIRGVIVNVNIDKYLDESSDRNALAGSDTLWTKLVINENDKRTSVFKTNTSKDNQSKN